MSNPSPKRCSAISLGSLAMILSATAARNTERTMTYRVLIVVGASSMLIVFTHASTWDRRIDFIDRSAKGT